MPTRMGGQSGGESFSSSPSTSAAAKLQLRRLAQYKSITTPTTRCVSGAYYHSRPKLPAVADEPSFGVRLFCSVGASPGEENHPHDALLRD
jgi:hypothetical protein